ncbi:DNA adenine methylase [Planktothrix sp. FACHB-1355]|uniref:DNA adenine methylase n=1 Tax=Aerosakkonema funiforme FACHB-1375 TaxID=2949571 RepID=A0A926ZJE5_9CYAN|nr:MULTISPECIES: DNA adenine methylase [Oscillatoriales]MBD2185453.1 DNA adenine methylase [Aerosakkonema funiforme FACHB-1375]MBD3558155.1 DNA adenine methylase [Planktothrix sp. FACHB-1355]
MQQLSLFENNQLDRITNVSSVPQRSPFRYPGGKTWLVPRIRQWLDSLQKQPSEFIEPFAGGGIVSLTVAFEDLANHVTMVEIDEEVAAVWHTIINGDGEWLAAQIVNFNLSQTSVNTVLTVNNILIQEKAFKTILKNRVNRGGILAAGAGTIKSGENGKGLRSRWYPETLKKRIIEIMKRRERITFIEGDGMEVLKANAHRTDAVFFIDPPYTAAGKKAGSRLYNYSEIDHEELFRLASAIAGDFLMTYDNTEEVRQLAQKHGFDTQTVAMKNTHHAKMTELLIGRNLDWCR